MKTVVLYGSPRKSGNSATLTKEFLHGLNAQGDHEITEFYLNDMSIKPCQACHACFRNKNNRCVFEDDMSAVYPALENAELIVFASPIYWWHLASQMKLCLDRLTALLTPEDKLKALVGKKVAAVITYNHEHCSKAAVAMFEEFVTWINVDLTLITYCSKTGPASQSKEALEQAYALGEQVAQQGA